MADTLPLLEEATPRVVFIGNGTRGPFNLQDGGMSIRVRVAADLVVRRYSSTADDTGTLLVLNTDYTVTNTDPDSATLTLTMAQAVLTSSQRLVVERKQGVSGVILYSAGGNFSGGDLSNALGVVQEQVQELRRDADRAIKVDWRETDELTLPLPPATGQSALVRNADGTLGQVDVGDISSLAGIIADITTVAGIKDEIEDVAAIAPETVAVAAIAADVTAVADNIADIQQVAAALQPLTPEQFGAVGDGVTNDTTAIDAMFAAAISTGNKCIRFGPKRYLYSGTAMTMSGYGWDVQGCGHMTEFYRTTNGEFFRFDCNSATGGRSRIGNFVCGSNLANGSRANTHAVRVYNTGTAFGLIDTTFFNIFGSGVHNIIQIDKTAGFPFSGYDQLARYNNIRIEGCGVSSKIGTTALNGIVYVGGSGSHNIIISNLLEVLGASIIMGDGTQAIHDTIIVGNHLTGAVGGLDVYGPTDPAYYRRNLLAVGNQFDGNSTYTFRLDRLSHFRVRYNNSLVGTAPIVTNATGFYEYEDQYGALISDKLDVPYVDNAVNKLKLNSSTTGNALSLEATGSDTNISITATTKGSGSFNVDSLYATSSNGVRARGLRRDANDTNLTLAGGNLLSAGAILNLYGGAHSTLANQGVLLADTFTATNQAGSGNIIDWTTTRIRARVPIDFPSYTVGTAPTGAVTRSVYFTDMRVFNGAGTQEGAGLGTGGLANHNGTKWCVAGTNVTAVA